MTTALVRAKPVGVIDPYDNDQTVQVTVTINGTESDLIKQYCYDSDILQLGDPFSVILPDPHNRYANVVEGQTIKLNMASPLVGNGQKVQKILGVVTQVIRECSKEGGTVLNVAGADLGWHLCNNDAPIWKRLPGMTFAKLYALLVDPTWGFTGFRAGNDQNVKIKQGGNFTRGIVTAGDSKVYPIVQVEPGDKPADIFINYAKLANKLVNVSQDGQLQLFAPNYGPPPGTTPTEPGTFGTADPIAYRFYNYREDDRRNKYNNVEQARLTRKLDGRWNKAICVGTRVIPLEQGTNPNDPNANSFRGTWSEDVGVAAGSFGPSSNPSDVFQPIGFNRLTAFTDPDRLDKPAAIARAKWKLRRGKFDSWLYEITVRGHSQGGNFYEPDTIAEVTDTVLGVSGTLYVSAVRYERDLNSGELTRITMRQPRLLAA